MEIAKNNVESILNENERIQKFILDYQSKNDYNPKFLDEYNAKFNAEFTDFLENGNFTKETINLFKNQNYAQISPQKKRSAKAGPVG